MSSFKALVKDYDENGNIVTICEKIIYNTDDDTPASEWVRNISARDKEYTSVNSLASSRGLLLSGAVSTKDKGRGRLAVGAMGYMHNAGNSVRYNQQLVGLYSSCFSNGHGLSIVPGNLMRAAALFAARKLITSSWINHEDEYLAPSEEHADYIKFAQDSLVFSLFESKSNQSALRDVPFNGGKTDIHNQFFFMSVEEMKELAEKHNFNELYTDCVGKTDPYIYKLLLGGSVTLSLSPDARIVLEKARELVRLSFPLRQAAHLVKPEMHLQAFDAGWYQIRNGILKDSFKEQYKDFVATYKTFGDRLRPLVYELGFLKK